MKYFENQRLVDMDCWAAGNDNHEKLQFDEFEAFLEEKRSNHTCCLYFLTMGGEVMRAGFLWNCLQIFPITCI